MKSTFYVQTTAEGRVTDIIEYPHKGYAETELETPLPDRCISGCYRLDNDGENNCLTYVPEWDISVTEAEAGDNEEIPNESDL